jgi:hypothetical protein
LRQKRNQNIFLRYPDEDGVRASLEHDFVPRVGIMFQRKKSEQLLNGL